MNTSVMIRIEEVAQGGKPEWIPSLRMVRAISENVSIFLMKAFLIVNSDRYYLYY